MDHFFLLSQSKGWHKGGSGKRRKSTSQHPQSKVLPQPARGTGTRAASGAVGDAQGTFIMHLPERQVNQIPRDPVLSL